MDTPTQTPVNKPKYWTKLHQILHDNHGVRYFVIAVGIIIATGLAVLAWLYQQPTPQAPRNTPVAPKPKEEPKFYSPLTGVKVKDEKATKRTVTAIMLENSPDARPQSGLKEAGVVFEAIAEGGITRFNALYQESRPKLIGPVRSLRPYYVEWAAAFDPSVAHVGGSARALKMIRNGNYGRDIDQFFSPNAYWRASDRYAPHNVYTSFERLDALNKSKGFTTSSFDGFPRVDAKPAAKPNATRVAIDVSSHSYNVNYTYNKKSNTYSRSQGGAPHNDREKGRIAPKVAIVIKVPQTTVFEDGSRESYKVIGSGQAFIFQNGTVQKATWKKSGAKSQLTFIDSEKEPIELVRGQTWITAIGNDRGVTWQ